MTRGTPVDMNVSVFVTIVAHAAAQVAYLTVGVATGRVASMLSTMRLIQF
jgi:hypothetical protein